MSIPALRQPKSLKSNNNRKTKTPNKVTKIVQPLEPQKFLIVTLNDGKKLVVSTDAYHGILAASELYRCVFCETEMVIDKVCKERHIQSQNHRKILENYPHIEEFQDNLIRKLNGGQYYCTLCNVTVSSMFLYKHFNTEAHLEELQKARIRVQAYQPNNPEKEEWPALK